MHRRASRLARLNHGHNRRSRLLHSSEARHSGINGSNQRRCSSLNVENRGHRSETNGPVTTGGNRNARTATDKGKEEMMTEGRDVRSFHCQTKIGKKAPGLVSGGLLTLMLSVVWWG